MLCDLFVIILARHSALLLLLLLLLLLPLQNSLQKADYFKIDVSPFRNWLERRLLFCRSTFFTIIGKAVFQLSILIAI